MQVKNSVIVITGAASGIGEASAIALSEIGAQVVLGDMNEDGVNVVAKKINDNGGKAVAKFLDVTD